ncbi:hypothetical protein LTR08_007154 [Meristemomyces frigidus]|nr:hypothetical protein LTR08_007154 [Meristemomyces frigidus]
MSSPSSARVSMDSTNPTSPTSTRASYPFPDAAHRASSSNRYQPRRGSNASIASANSIGGSLDTQHGRRNSTVRETGQNAISTLLQPPGARTGLVPHAQPPTAFRAPTTRDIPPVTLTSIPHVAPDNFRDYLGTIGPLFDTFQRGRLEPDEAPPTWLQKDKELDRADRFAEALERRFSKDGSTSPTLTRQSPTSSLSPLGTPGPDQPRRRSSAQFRRNRNAPVPLSTIPIVYFDHAFHLENPRTFDLVSEHADIVPPAPGTPQPPPQQNGTPQPPRKALATNAILQEKLSWYLDTVEVHLINSISTASSGFFQALGSLQELQTEAEESVAKIQGLREDLRRLDQEVAGRGLEVAAKRRKRANVAKLACATRQVEKVVEDVKRADQLVDAGAYDDAADCLDGVGRLIRGQPHDPASQPQTDLIDLRPLKALQGLSAGLQDLHARIGAGLAARFTALLVADLRQHVARVPRAETLKRWSRQRGVPPTYMETSANFRQEVLAALKGLARAGGTAQATTSYRDAVNKLLKELIRAQLPSSSDEDGDSMVSSSTRGGGGSNGKLSQQEKSTILARNLRALDAGDAEVLLVGIYTQVGEALRRVSTQTKVLLDVTSSMHPAAPAPAPGSPSSAANPDAGTQPSSRAHDDEELSQALDMSSLLGQAVDTAHSQISRILKVRNDQTTHLSVQRFLRYVQLNRLFADESEAVSGRDGQALRGVVAAQMGGFVRVLGRAESEGMAGVLDGDDWNARDFGEGGEGGLRRGGGVVGQRVDGEQGKGTPATATTNGTASSTPTPPNGTPKPPTPAPPTPLRPAIIPPHPPFTLVASAIHLLTPINTLLALTCALPPLTPQLTLALLDVFRTFNSRSTQLILGAGATRGRAALKNITTKHLALASQGVGFGVVVLGCVRACVGRKISGGGGGGGGGGGMGLMVEFDKVKRMLLDHQAGIHDKLVEILVVRSGVHVKALLALARARSAAVAAESTTTTTTTIFAHDAETSAKLPEQDASSEKPSPYMETLTKETLTLHRVLSRYLADSDVADIMRRIGEGFLAQWPAAFGEARKIVVEGGGETGWLGRDAGVFEARLGRVGGFGGVVAAVGGAVGVGGGGGGK